MLAREIGPVIGVFVLKVWENLGAGGVLLGKVIGVASSLAGENLEVVFITFFVRKSSVFRDILGDNWGVIGLEKLSGES